MVSIWLLRGSGSVMAREKTTMRLICQQTVDRVANAVHSFFFLLVAQLQHVVMPLGYLQSTSYQGSFSLSAADSVIPGG